MADLEHVSQQQFAQWVHDAFAHLYDSRALQKNPIALMLVDEESDPIQRGISLRRTLLEAIRLARPPAGVPADSADWRHYRILRLRYIEGMTPHKAMQELALGRSQFYHEQARGLEEMTALLWGKFQPYIAAVRELPDENAKATLIREEMSRLYVQLDWGQVDATGLLEELRPMLSDLLGQQGAQLELDLTQRFLLPRANRVLLRQAILNLVTAVLDTRMVHYLKLGVLEDRIYCQVSWDTPGPPEAVASASSASLAVVRQLVNDIGGTLEVCPSAGSLRAELCWAEEKAKCLMVVDDNQDLAALFQRYLATQSWQVVGAANGVEARAQIAAKLPTVIAMDVLMPKQDGWELLSALKRSAVTRDIPVIVCSVLKQPQLALALGADAYLTKPVTREALLAMLRRWG